MNPAAALPRASRRAIVLALLCGLVGGLAWAGEARPFRFLVVGGTEGERPVHHQIIAQMVKVRPELVLHVGDAVRDGRKPKQWQAFDRITKPLTEICPLYPVHCKKDGARLFGGRFRMPDGTLRGQTYYSFVHRNACFIALDSTLGVRPKDAQTAWLADELAKAGRRHIFVFFNLPILSIARRRILGRMASTFWGPLFERHKVQAVFAGNHHIYYRTTQKGVYYIVTGGGGAGPLDMLYSAGRRYLLRNDVAGSYHHFVEVTVAGDKVRYRVIDNKGRTRDQFPAPDTPIHTAAPSP